MLHRTSLLLLAALYVLLPTATAQCQMSGVTTWALPVNLQVLDTHRGEFFRAGTTNILSITSAVHTGDALNRGPYFTSALEDSQFVLTFNDQFAEYEEYEYSGVINIQVSFTCTGGNNNLVFSIQVQDTNNNDPRFAPSDAFTFNIMPPIVPGYELTGCNGELVVRDIDLTTQSIVFSIEENPYVAISYGGVDPTDSKNFHAVLTATTVIRSLAEPLVLQITATDVDLTGDPPRTTQGTVTIEATDQFELPAEPVFSAAFYTGAYSADHQLTLQQTIALSQGYDDEVVFTLTGEYEPYFGYSSDGNSVSIFVSEQLPAEVLRDETHLTLVVQAAREYTSGATSAVVVELPQASSLQFEQISYEGVIQDNALQLNPLQLSVDVGSGDITAVVLGAYQNYFSAQVTGTSVTISMSLLPEAVVLENSFINLLVEASSGGVSTSAVVTLDIVKEDIFTPVFSQDFYSGSYDEGGGLQMSEFSLSQGYDETVIFSLNGDDAQYFDIEQSGNWARLVLSPPPELVAGRPQLLFSVRAAKPGTVGAAAAVSVALPAARTLRFDEDSYTGSLEGSALEIGPMFLSEGYAEDVTFTLTGEFDTFFAVSNDANAITLTVVNPLPIEASEANEFIVLVVEAAGDHAIPAKAAIVLGVVKDDTSTPIFSERVYNGIFTESQEVALATPIALSQGYDGNVGFSLEGDNSEYFGLVVDGNSLDIEVTSPLPSDVIELNSHLVFSVVASKPGTVGAHATLSLSLPQERELRFEQDSYTGTLENNNLLLPTISLSQGYRDDVTFNVIGDYLEFFEISGTEGVATIELVSPLPADVVDNNSFVILILEASGPAARTARTVATVELIKGDVAPPVFSQYVYNGLYDGSQLTLAVITVSEGYDETVTFSLDGEDGEYFAVENSANIVSIFPQADIPAEVLSSNSRLVFTLIANKLGSVSANAAISIALPEVPVPRFAETSYTGSTNGDSLLLDQIVLVDGYTEQTVFAVNGPNSDYFGHSNVANTVTIYLLSALPQDVINDNVVIVLELVASGTQAISAQTTIVLEIEKDGEAVVPVFTETFYTGSYTETEGLVSDVVMSLAQGFDDTVTFALTGDQSEWFTFQQTGNLVTLLVAQPLPSAVVANNPHLIFSIVANKPGTVGASSAISISLPDDFSTARVLRFEQASYYGSTSENELQLDQIILIDGYQDGDVFSLNEASEYSAYFGYSNVANTVTIYLLSTLPQDVINDNVVIVLELVASGTQAISAQTTIVLEIVKDGEAVVPVFTETFYTGSYTETEGFVSDVVMSLAQGFDDTVTFTLTGDHSEWFTFQQTGNLVTLLVAQPIPSAVVANNNHLIFSIVANKPGTVGSSSAISISLPDDLSTARVLRFEQGTFTGTVIENELQLDPITLADGYQDGDIFSITGDNGVYFGHSNVGNVVTIYLLSTLPQDLINENTVIIFELEASGSQAISAQTTIVLEIVKDGEAVVPVFTETFYTGSYTETEGLVSDVVMSLAQGFDDTVTFALTGDHSEWFTFQQTGNLVTLLVAQPIPSAVVANNNHLIFSIVANKPGTVGSSSAISISLPDDLSTARVLRFEQGTFTGTVIENELQLDPITLADGYQDGDIFSITGDNGVYFGHSNVGNVVTIYLLSTLPQDLINENTVIIFELQASGSQAISAQTTIVLEIVKDGEAVVPVFTETFYTGSYTETEGLVSDVVMSLAQGFDDTVTFALTGDHSEWFTFQQTGNLVTLLVAQPIPSAVVANNNHLIFSIVANKPGTVGSSSAISISLPDDLSTARVLRFEQGTFTGTVIENELQLDPITLADGYQDGDIFSITGDNGVYFGHSNVGNVVTIYLLSTLPQDLINENTVIIFELEASGSQAISAQTTIVLEIVKDGEAVVPVFTETFYTGSYTETEGLVSDVVMSLAQGFDDTVTFALTGDHSEWFTFQQTGNLVTLLVAQPIPSAVVANNNQLIFSIVANKPGTVGSSSAISISLPDDLSTARVLRFEQGTYTGTVIENELQLDPITLADGYQDGDIFSITGDNGVYFGHSNVGNVVTIYLLSTLPQDLINENTVIIFELEASGSQAISAQTTIVLEIVKDGEAVVPVFTETFYTGSYTETEGLVSEVVMSLAQGFDDTVTFALTGDHSEWFTFQQTGNLVTLLVAQPIPSAVVANNNHLIFSIVANKPGTVGSSSAISISLPDDLSTARVLRFEQGTFTGTVIENELQLDPITLADGYQDGDIFSITGDNGVYFGHSNVGNVVTIYLLSTLPQDLINENTVIIFELEASGSQAISAQTTIVLEIVKDGEAVVPVFTETFYTGSYTETEGLVSDVVMSLAQGFDDTVTFALTGDHSEWFTFQQTGNLVTLLVAQPIPSAVVANNNHLIFSIVANKPGTVGSSSAISISLPDDLSTARVLRFEQGTYTGTVIENELQLDPITLADGYQDGDIFSITGDNGVYFGHSNVGNVVTIYLLSTLPQDLINENTVIIFELEASSSQAISAQTTIVLEIVKDGEAVVPVFTETFYTGSYTETEGLVSDVVMSLAQGFDDTVTFALTGDHSEWFTFQQTGNLVTLLVAQPIPSAVVANNNQLIFSIVANKPGTVGSSSAISISLPYNLSTARVLRFEQGTYTGTVIENELQLDPITLADGYQDGDIFSITGDNGVYFGHSNVGNVVTIYLLSTLPQDLINENTVIIFELEASGSQAISAQTTIVLEIVKDGEAVVPVFTETFYTGSYTETEGLVSEVVMSLAQGFDDTVTFALTGDHSEWFTFQQTGNLVTLLVAQPIPSAVVANNNHLIFSIVANKPGTVGSSSAISISLPDDLSTARVLRFEQGTFTGTVIENELQLDPITLADGYQDGDIFSITGDNGVYFGHSNVGNVVTIYLLSTLPQDLINENTVIIFELQASGSQAISAQTTIVLEIVKDGEVLIPMFSETFYTGSYTETEGLVSDVVMSLAQGFDDTVTFVLSGEQSVWFTIQQTGNSVTLLVAQPVPSAVVANNYHLMFTIIANKPGTLGTSSAISISLPGGEDGGGASFERALYVGSLEQGVVTHEAILVLGYTGGDVQLDGEYESQFSAEVTAVGVVTVQAVVGATVPPDVTHVSLQLDAGVARAALVLAVLHTESAGPPSVAFDSPTYVLRADAAQSGLLGRVSAAADDGETLLYSLLLDNSHLAERLSVSSQGELWLAAPASSGVYQFTVLATTVATQVTAEATVHLTVDSVVVCGDDDRILDPLIVLDRDEEEPHDDLIVLNEDLASECSYSFTYRWPLDRDWLFINERGHLSALAIDREDPAIAFMALSQIQIELVLTCAEANVISRSRRDVTELNQTMRDLGPYDYGTNRWILTDGISYNSRRSFVNIIINDINDNAPIFVGKENEPIVVGYPVYDILDSVSPSALVSLQATDADVGENAELVYWSAAAELAVARAAGSVHVRDNAARALTDGALYTVHATDRAGAATGSLTGDIDIMVRLLDLNHIAVLTIRNALLDDERDILDELNTDLEYEIKSLRATVISDEYDVPDEFSNVETVSRQLNKRLNDNSVINESVVKRSRRQAEASAVAGASLRIFIYGLAFTEPIEATQLISDIDNLEISGDLIISYEVTNLREYLDSVAVIVDSGSSTSLLVSTIVLSCLLFLIIVFIIVWYFIFIRKQGNKYLQFSGTNSRSSSTTLDPPPKIEDMVRPRPDIEEIKRTERRLQEMLDQPVSTQEPALIAIETSPKSTVRFDTVSELPQSTNYLIGTISGDPNFSNVDTPTISNLAQSDDQLPIVIQSIGKLKKAESSDDEDEYGENLKAKRKSVVTFSEQVKKIIHVEDIADEQDTEMEIYKL